MRRPIKAHLVNRSNRPVYRSKPVTHAILNLDLNSTGTDQFPAKPDRYRTPAVWPVRSVNETLIGISRDMPLH